MPLKFHPILCDEESLENGTVVGSLANTVSIGMYGYFIAGFEFMSYCVLN
jgi:hypothetical protein